MPRQPTPEQLAEYARMRDFALALSEVMDELIRASPPSRVGVRDPDGTLREYEAQNDDLNQRAALAEGLEELERQSIAQARTGIRLALQDLLEDTRFFTPELVRSVDARFAAAGLPTLSAMRREVWKTIPKVLARGLIRNEEEYYLLIERLNDVSGEDGLTPEERDRLGHMVAAFEERKARSRRG